MHAWRVLTEENCFWLLGPRSQNCLSRDTSTSSPQGYEACGDAAEAIKIRSRGPGRILPRTILSRLLSQFHYVS
jgi:hypothetical protein